MRIFSLNLLLDICRITIASILITIVLFFSKAFLMDKYPDTKRGRKEVKARKKAEKRLAKDSGLPPPAKKPKTFAKTPLEVIVQYNQLDLIMHPVFQRLLYVKWELFGKRSVSKELNLQL